MPEKWTGILVGKMHNAGVTCTEIAQQLGVTKEYVSMILNGKRTPPMAKERLNAAFTAILERRKAE